MNVVLRTTLSPAALAQSSNRYTGSRRAVPVVRLREMDDVFAETIRRPRLLAQLVGGFAGLAFLLAAIGTYGVLSFTVAERRREIGIRLALGAARAQVLAQVMKQGLVLTTSESSSALRARSLEPPADDFAVRRGPGDTATTIGVIATMTLVAAAACWLPAWRASRLDPNVVLRDE